MSDLKTRHLTTEEFSQKFYESDRGQEILDKLKSPYNEKDAEFVRTIAKEKFANTQQRSLGLVMRRELLLWRRDTYRIRSKIGQSMYTQNFAVLAVLEMLHKISPSNVVCDRFNFGSCRGNPLLVR